MSGEEDEYEKYCTRRLLVVHVRAMHNGQSADMILVHCR